MSNRPGPTRARPWGSTGANSTKSIPARIARAKRYGLSPFPRNAVPGKHVLKQGFPGTSNVR